MDLVASDLLASEGVLELGPGGHLSTGDGLKYPRSSSWFFPRESRMTTSDTVAVDEAGRSLMIKYNTLVMFTTIHTFIVVDKD